MKKIALTIILFFVPAVILAQNTTPGTSSGLTIEEALRQYKRAASLPKKMEGLITLGQKMIGKRVADLEKVQTRLQAVERISEETKTELLNRVAQNTIDLQALEIEIEDTEDLEAMKEKVRSIVFDYHIYLVFIPQIRGLAVVDRLKYFAEKIAEVKDKIEEELAALEEKGEDLSAIWDLAESAEEQLAEGLEFTQRAEDKFSSMKVGDIEAAQDLKAGARKDLASGRSSLRKALQSLRQAWQEIKKLETQGVK